MMHTEEQIQDLFQGLQRRNERRRKRRRKSSSISKSGAWDRMLERQTVPHAFGWAGPAEVPRLLAGRGNPYLDFWRDTCGPRRLFEPGDSVPPAFRDEAKLIRAFGRASSASIATFAARDYATVFFGWAVPDGPALSAIAELDKPVLELGSGRGYWAWQLEQRGVRVVCEEPHAYEWYWRRPDRVHHRAMPHDHALLFCWPTYDVPWPAHLLREYQGHTVVCVGEPEGGCTADDTFHRLLAERFTEERTVQIPQWYGIHDELSIWRR